MTESCWGQTTYLFVIIRNVGGDVGLGYDQVQNFETALAEPFDLIDQATLDVRCDL